MSPIVPANRERGDYDARPSGSKPNTISDQLAMLSIEKWDEAHPQRGGGARSPAEEGRGSTIRGGNEERMLVREKPRGAGACRFFALTVGRPRRRTW